jgi:hypothetical protein
VGCKGIALLQSTMYRGIDKLEMCSLCFVLTSASFVHPARGLSPIRATVIEPLPRLNVEIDR